MHASLPFSLLTLALFIGDVAPSQGANGNINPLAIEIDPSANLHPSGAPGLVDWVRDSLPNTDPASLVKSIATGLIRNVTAATGGSGHWHGVRIVDGIAGNDRNIFLTGGKENDTSTWNIGPGSVGSSKYDITQAYLANNQQTLFFGMERRGNNGTTAFDFEFNQLAPNPARPLIPTRTLGDVMFTFEMNGSATSGSAVPHYFVWNGTRYVELSPPPPSLVSSINNTDIPAAPWGFVDSKGAWMLGNLPRYSFAEASVKLSEAFPNFTPCGNATFVQVRTRSSATASSDLKDTTDIFEFRFGGPEATASYGLNCQAQFTYTGIQSHDSGGGNALTYLWDFIPQAGVTLSGTGVTGPDANGIYHSTQASGQVNVPVPAGAEAASVNARLTVIEGAACTDSSDLQTVTVLRELTAAITQKTQNGSTLAVSLTGVSPGATFLQWQRQSGVFTWVNIPGATTATLAYSSFESDSTPEVQNFNIDGTTFAGKLWQVHLRLHAERNVWGMLCTADSAPVTVKKVTAVDP